MKKRILHVAPFIPCPATTSGDMRTFHDLQALAGEFDQYWLSLIGGAGKSAADADPLRPFVSGLEVLPATRETITGDPQAPAAIDCHYASALVAAIRRRLAEFRPDLVHFEFWFMAQYAEHVPELRGIPTTVLEMDVEYVTRRLMRPEENDVPWEKYREYELRYLGRIATILAVSTKDRRVLNQDLPGKPVSVIPTYMPAAPVGPEPKEFAAVFVGAFDHFPNDDGIRWFLREGFPAVRARHPELTFYIVGRRPTTALRELAAADPRVIVTGAVPEVYPYLRRALFSIVPLRIGSGIKTKICEAWGHGLPVVTTPIGLEGMEDAPGALVGRTPAELAAQIDRLISEPALRSELGRAGLAHYRREFSHETFADRLRAVFRAALD